MLSQVSNSQNRKYQAPKTQKRSSSIEMSSPRQNNFTSGSKSMRAFQDSLRKYDEINPKSSELSSPLNKKLSFGKANNNLEQIVNQVYLIDVTKKIRKVQSPFAKNSTQKTEQRERQLIFENNLFASQFSSIPERIQELLDSSSDGEKACEQIFQSIQNSQIKVLTESIDILMHKIENIFCEKIVNTEEFQKQNIMDIQNNSQLQNQEDQSESCSFKEIKIDEISRSHENISKSYSQSLSSKNRSDEFRLKKKDKKKKIKKEKKKIAKNVKVKLSNILNFVEDLIEKKPVIDRQKLVRQLSNHLCEKKFKKLRRQLKMLI